MKTLKIIHLVHLRDQAEDVQNNEFTIYAETLAEKIHNTNYSLSYTRLNTEECLRFFESNKRKSTRHFYLLFGDYSKSLDSFFSNTHDISAIFLNQHYRYLSSITISTASLLLAIHGAKENFDKVLWINSNHGDILNRSLKLAIDSPQAPIYNTNSFRELASENPLNEVLSQLKEYYGKFCILCTDSLLAFELKSFLEKHAYQHQQDYRLISVQAAYDLPDLQKNDIFCLKLPLKAMAELAFERLTSRNDAKATFKPLHCSFDVFMDNGQA